MPAKTVVRARINGKIKNDAAALLFVMGLTIPGAFRIMLTRIAREKVLPFTPFVPNDGTIGAMKVSGAAKWNQWS